MNKIIIPSAPFLGKPLTYRGKEVVFCARPYMVDEKLESEVYVCPDDPIANTFPLEEGQVPF